ncbi:SixA phosphatase family protein [Actibacterium lipolyticum]|uniref:Histidine phosphatase superfamily (Branch 1) n=1 Tax=Actibacterium lipolyticum TaxID=1524263 RepID=A0A238JMJ5_9RHOB|nr:histidine phosphatase family protein [Actibacterium lipolyticum]SMX30996.1 Histidine phosphatase superfamily (branch 1) [Actibacterium lipolyticum]
MTLRLILVRHAKSSWDDPFQDDHDRVLNKRGQRAAPAIAEWLSNLGYLPAEVVSSTARRTVETWERMAPSFPQGTVMRRDPALYHAPAERMMEVLRQSAASPVLMLGHNPGIGDFATRLLSARPDHPRFGAYPTCATLVVDFDADDWADVRFGTGTAVDFIVPGELDIAK